MISKKEGNISKYKKNNGVVKRTAIEMSISPDGFIKSTNVLDNTKDINIGNLSTIHIDDLDILDSGDKNDNNNEIEESCPSEYVDISNLNVTFYGEIQERPFNVNYIDDIDLPNDTDKYDENDIRVFASKLPRLDDGQARIFLYKAYFDENSLLNVLILIKNNGHGEIPLNFLPLTIIDAKGEVVAKQIFENNGIYVRGMASKVVKIKYDNESIIKRDIDLKNASFIIQA